jgi:pyruvate kinase
VQARQPAGELLTLIDQVETIRSDMLRLVEDSADLLRGVHPQHRASATNLLQYLALRGRDLRPLQLRLAAAGLSSLGRAESYVLTAVETVLAVLRRLADQPASIDDAAIDRIDMAEGQRLLAAHTDAVLGSHPARDVAIMVTMPSEAADDYTLVRDLLQAGMDSVRINCAHDAQEQWERMIEHVRRATERHGQACRIMMDLAGPKVRTGPLEPGPKVVKFRPARDARVVVEPARVWLFAGERPHGAPTPAAASLPVSGDWLRTLEPGDAMLGRVAQDLLRGNGHGS